MISTNTRTTYHQSKLNYSDYNNGEDDKKGYYMLFAIPKEGIASPLAGKST